MKILLAILIVAYVAYILRLLYHIILDYDNNSPVKAIGWIFVVIFIPLLGVLCYTVIGRNLRKRYSTFEEWRTGIKNKPKPVFRLNREENPDLLEKYTELGTFIENLTELPAFSGNCIDVYPSARKKFDYLFADMKKARNHIHILYYAIGDDEIGNQFKELITRKAREGVKVRLIYDDVGCNKVHKRFFREIKESGVEIAVFSPVTFPRLLKSVNYRNHKKIVVIDGIIGYTGGINVKDEYLKGVKWGVWKDLHVRIKGPGVQGLQSVFLIDWYYTTKTYPEDPDCYPFIDSCGEALVQAVSSEPVGGHAAIMEAIFKAITLAQKSVYIESPYFVPSASLLTALKTTALSGVEVGIVIPRHSDNIVVQHASNSYIEELIESGVKIYQYDKGFIHSKLLIVDGELTIAGSSNMDIRSFDLNFECNVFIYSRTVASKAYEIFQDDVQNSVVVDNEQWYHRSKKQKFAEAFFRLLSPIM